MSFGDRHGFVCFLKTVLGRCEANGEPRHCDRYRLQPVTLDSERPREDPGTGDRPGTRGSMSSSLDVEVFISTLHS